MSEGTTRLESLALALGSEFPSEWHQAGQTLASTREGLAVLARVAGDPAASVDARVAADRAFPLDGDPALLESFAVAFLRDLDVGLRYRGICRCVRSGLFQLAPRVVALRDCPDDFVDFDSLVVLSEVARRAEVLLDARQSDPEFDGLEPHS